MNNWSRSERLTLYALFVALITAIAALLVVPEIRRLLGLEFSSNTSNSPQQIDQRTSSTANVSSSNSSTQAFNGNSLTAPNINKPDNRSTDTPIDQIRSPAQIPFQISSMSTKWPLGIMLKGQYAIYPDYIEIDVTNVMVQLRRFNWLTYNGPRRLVTINIVLVRTPADKPANWGGWDEISFGKGVNANCDLNPGDQCTLTDLHFSIPKDSSLDLSKHWLVVRLEDQLLDGKTPSGYEYAHGSKEIFAQR